MANVIKFTCLFFDVIEGVELMEETIKKINKEKPFFSKRKKIRLAKWEESDDYNLIIGDLQQIHETDLGCKIRIGQDKTITEEAFQENEGLGYNNVFAYHKHKNIMALQDNRNGVGWDSFEDLLNQNKAFIFGNRSDIRLAPIILKDQLDEVSDFTSIEFAISKYTEIDDESFSDFNKFVRELKANTCKVMVKNETFLEKSIAKKILCALRDNKDLKPSTLKTTCLLGGENVELNFLHHKAKIVKDINIIENKKLEYEARKVKIQECLNEFFKLGSNEDN